jgi:hypothetical protein
MILPKKLPRDRNQLAYEVVRLSTGEVEPPVPERERSPVSAYLSEIGRRGGLKGGSARAKVLSAKKRSSISAKAARARWKVSGLKV